MGRKIGKFASRDGNLYEVVLSGEKVVDAELTLGVPPVVISMAPGEHKFCGFKSTTATITILTDSPLVDLYTERDDGILVEVTEVTNGAVVYRGYVTPFAFEQPMTGCLDAVTVNAVDVMTVRKNVRYNNIGDVHGVDITALDIVRGIAHRAGLVRVVEHINFNGMEDQGTDPLSVMVAQAGFLQDDMGDCDVLSAICKFFGYTGHVVGDTLYLYDEHALVHASGEHRTNATEWRYDGGRWVEYRTAGDSEDDVVSPLVGQYVMGRIRNDVSVSIERAYDGIQITPEGSEVSVLLPDVCADDNLSAFEDAETYTLATETGVEYRVERESHVMTFAHGEEDYVARDDWNGAALLMNVQRATRDEFNLGNDVVTIWKNELPKNYVRVRPQEDYSAGGMVYGQQWVGSTYSHTGGLAKLSLKFRIIALTDWKDTEKVVDIGDTHHSLALVAVNCGGRRLLCDYAQTGKYHNVWPSRDEYAGGTMLVRRGDEFLPTGVAQSIRVDGVIIEPPTNGAVSVDIAFAGWPSWYVRYEYLIEELSLVGYGEPIELSALRHRFRGGDEYLDVSTALTTRATGGTDITKVRVNARPGVVTDTVWNGAYMGRSDDAEAIPLAGVLMEQLKERYKDPHVAYTMTVDKRIKPYASVVYDGDQKTVESYDWDIYNNETTITID